MCQYVDKDSDNASDYNDILTILSRVPHYVAFFVTIVTIIFSYSNIWWHVRKSRKTIERGETLKCTIKSTQSVKMKKKQSRKQMRLTMTMIIVCVFFVTCVLPLIMLEHFVDKIGYNGIISLYWAQYSINVFVYAARRDEFWKAYKDVFDLMVCPFKAISNLFSYNTEGMSNGTPKKVLQQSQKAPSTTKPDIPSRAC